MIPPKQNAAFACCMEDVLIQYRAPYDPSCPVVCLDEMPVGLVSDAREPLPMKKGRSRREDYEYVRNGSATVFGALDLKAGKRLFEVFPRRTKRDFAYFLRQVVEELCKGAQRVRLVLDNLSTHTKAALYEMFPPEEALQLAQKLEFHYTPLHGSWLNAVELEFAACHKQCIEGRRIGALEELCRTMRAWQDMRNEERARIRWTFGVEQAREKLPQIYPKNEA